LRKLFEEDLVLLNPFQNLNDFFEFGDCWILADIVLFLMIDILRQDIFALLVISAHPMINISQSLLQFVEFHQLIVHIQQLLILQ